jgi:hypothetical protein
MENLDALVYGDCTDELELQGAVCPSLYGVHFVTQQGKGASGVWLAHASDTARVSALFDGLAPAGVDFINSNLVCYSPADQRSYCGADFRSEARFYNTATWGEPDYSAVVKSGSLVFEVARFNNYAPFLVDGGKLTLSNVCLAGNLSAAKELQIQNGGQVTLVGDITHYGMRSNSGAPAGAVTARFETSHSLPAVAGGKGPVAAWDFAEGQGHVVKDTSGNGHDGTIESPQWRKGPLGPALVFNGEGRNRLMINTRGMPESKALTVEAWVYPQEVGAAANLLNWDRRLNLRIDDKREKGRFACFAVLRDGSLEPRAPGAVAQAGAWQHVVAVWDGVYLQVWVNGEPGAEAQRTGSLLGPADGALILGWGFHGMIRALRLYDRPLAEEEIRAHYRGR